MESEHTKGGQMGRWLEILVEGFLSVAPYEKWRSLSQTPLNSLKFLEYKSFASLGRFTLTCSILLDAMVNFNREK